MATGAIIASAIPNPLISTPLILGFHYLEDFAIHWDAGTGLSSGRKQKSTTIKHGLIDLAFGFLFVYMFFQKDTHQLNFVAWYGAFVALIPDFLEAPKNFFTEPKFLRPFNRFHDLFHNSTPNMILGLTPQLILLFVIVILQA